jgi:hypothetical protein
MQNKEPEFYVEVSRPGQFGVRTSTVFSLPALQSKFKDAMQKARVTDERVTYGFELLDCKRGFLRPFIKGNENLNALNEFAKLLQRLEGSEATKFEAMVSIEAKRNNGNLSLQQLSNLANSTLRCHVVWTVRSDEQLGRFLLDSDMLSNADYEWIKERRKGPNAAESFAFLGKNHREAVGGTITNTGYVEFDGDVNKFILFNASDIVVQFREARCADCIIPDAVDWINSAVDKESVEGFLATVTRFHENGELTQYSDLTFYSRYGIINRKTNRGEKDG